MGLKTCTRCLNVLPEESFQFLNSRKRRNVCRRCRGIPAKESERERRRREEAIIRLGGACHCCGESRIEFLEIHHTKEDGHAHKTSRNGKRLGSRIVYNDILRGRPVVEDLTAICGSCHTALHLYGRCPHRREGDTYVVEGNCLGQPS
jgi:hypothetical protein